jgi:hypothetical protein
MSRVIRFPDLLHKALCVRGAGETEATFLTTSLIDLLGIDIARNPTGGIPPEVFFTLANAIFTEGGEQNRTARELLEVTLQRLCASRGITNDEMVEALAKFQRN